jgi:hypothetical protein
MTARRRKSASLFMATLLAVFVATSHAAAQTALPEVDLTLIIEVRDIAGWRAFHTEILGTRQQGQKSLDLAIGTRDGGARGLTVVQPKFDVSVIKGAPVFRVTVRGKLGPVQALGELGAFEEAVVDSHARPGEATLGLYYGLSTVGADVLEFHASR